MSTERRDFARALRQQMTRAEEILWARPRRSRFHGAKFKRQVLFDRYVVDFYCHAAKLVVELDGKQHEWFADYDSGRMQVLEALAFGFCASPMPRFAMSSTAFWLGFRRNCGCPSIERGPLTPAPLPSGEGRRLGSRSR